MFFTSCLTTLILDLSDVRLRHVSKLSRQEHYQAIKVMLSLIEAMIDLMKVYSDITSPEERWAGAWGSRH